MNTYIDELTFDNNIYKEITVDKYLREKQQ